MASVCIKAEYSAYCDDYVKEFVCDTDEDFATLPKACVGSTAVSLASGAVRVVNTTGEWVAFGEG